MQQRTDSGLRSVASGLRSVASGLRSVTFPAGLAPDAAAADARTAAWLEAMALGFHDPRPEPGHLVELVRAWQQDGRVLTGVHDDDAAEYGWQPAAPVATYATLVNDLNVGGGVLPAHQITMVTVRPTHRRRGILRSVMTADLQQAKAAGFALAALGASEAVIYGRFGFGVATSEVSVQVDVRGGLELRTPPSGTTAFADPASAEALAPQIFARHLASVRGALGRQYSYAKRASGAWGEDEPEPDRNVRVAVHYDESGAPAGYASFTFLPWRTDPHTLAIRDLVAVDDAAALELWRFLGSIDLVERITWGRAAESDPLPWALADRRRYQVKSVNDQLWLRALDPAAMLAARGWEADGEAVVEVADPMGLAAGSWHLRVRAGTADVVPLDGGAAGADLLADLSRIELDATAFASLYLGGVSAEVLAAAGGIRADARSLEAVARLFAVRRPPYCSTHF